MIGTLNEVIRDMESGVFDYTKDGKCVGCGKCCSAILPLSIQEIQNIKQYIKQHHIKDQKHIPPTREPVFDLTCPFLNENGTNQKCMIYPVRGEICKSFICSNPHGARENPKLLNEKYYIIDMRKTFFGE